ncbi:MAG: hypothetical protein ACRDJM_11230, partial [Actinomycetota bacterium]
GPRFVVFAGSMRRVGIPEELAQFRAYFAGFRIPVFAVPGTTDRFAGVDTAGVGGTGGNPTGSTEHWQQAFAGLPAPWGHDPAPANIRPVGGGNALTGARTHYAFDYMAGGRAAFRAVFVDSSAKSFGTVQDQNPSEDQSTWLRTTLTQATDVLGIPSMVFLNQPSVAPAEQQVDNWVGGTNQDFDASVVGARVSAVVAAGFRQNLKDAIKVIIPLYIVGGGGAPLGRELTVNTSAATKLPTDGYYHAWHLFRIDPANKNALGQARVTNEVYPVLESVALHSDRGLEIPAGETTSVTALARGLNGGFSDPDQSKTVHIVHGRKLYRCGYRDQGNGACISDLALMPAFRFRSLRPDIAEFVVPDPLNPFKPQRVQLPGNRLAPPVPDPGGAAGMLCTFEPGIVPIEVTAGLLRNVIELTVGPGSGPCSDIVFPPTPSPRPSIEPPPIPPEPEKPFLYLAPRVRPELVALFPPPPAPVVAPAPPGAPGVGRKEEHEVQTETESHGEYDFTANRAPAPERRYAFTPLRARPRDAVEEHGMLLMAAVAMSAFAMAAGLAAVRARREQEAREQVIR